MTLKEFVTLINRQEEIAVLKQGKDCDAKKLADIFENSCNTDTSDNELLCSKIKKNINENKGMYKFYQENLCIANADKLTPYIGNERELNQKWHVLIGLLAVLDTASFEEECKNDERLKAYRIGKINDIYLENEKLHIRAEKTKCYSSFGMIEFIEKALKSNQ